MTIPVDRRAVALAALGVALIPTCLLAPRAAVLLLGIAALISLAAAWRAGCRPRAPAFSVLACIVALLAWATLTATWSLAPYDSLSLAARLAALIAIGLLLHGATWTLDDGARTWAGRWFLGGLLAGLAYAALEETLGYPFVMALKPGYTSVDTARVEFNFGAAAMALAVWPASGVAWRAGHRWLSAVPPVAAGLLLPFLSSLSALWGLAAGGATLLIALTHRRAGRAVLIAGALVAFIGSPIAARAFYAWDWQSAEWLPWSAAHRVEIWRETLNRIEQRPVLGWGFNAARVIYRLPTRIEPSGRSPAGLHPHNAPLQILEELGLIGWGLALALLIVVALRIDRLPWPERVFAQATYLSALAVSTTTYSAWANHWLAVVLAMVALVPLTVPARHAADRRAL